MGEALSSMWSSGVPEVHEALKPLQGWKREELLRAMERFRSQPQLALRLAGFWRILDLKSEGEASRMFEALGAAVGGTIDFLSVIMPMVVMSQQLYISRVTFLFSIADFNSGGTVLHAEFYIALRSLFRGLQRFCPAARPASGKELEEVTDRIFDHIDVDNSGYLELEEILTYAYRSKDLRMLLAPFPSPDPRIFEELVHFTGSNAERERCRGEEVEKAERRLRSRLKVTPDPPAAGSRTMRKARTRPWRQPTVVIKPRAYLMWVVFDSLAKDGSIPRAQLVKVLGDHRSLASLVEAAEQRLAAEGSLEDDPEDRHRVATSVQSHLANPALLQGLADGCEQVSLRSLCSLVWPRVPEQEISDCVRWCRQFQALAALQELLKPTESALVNSQFDPARQGLSLDVEEDDIHALFEALDVDGDGKLSVEELHKEGHISVREAERLLQLWDGERSGTLSKGEITMIVFNMGQVVHRQLKGLFSASVQRGGAKP